MDYVGYYEEDEKNSLNFMNQVIRRAKEAPDQFKSDVYNLRKWSEKDGTGQWTKNYMNSRS